MFLPDFTQGSAIYARIGGGGVGAEFWNILHNQPPQIKFLILFGDRSRRQYFWSLSTKEKKWNNRRKTYLEQRFPHNFRFFQIFFIHAWFVIVRSWQCLDISLLQDKMVATVFRDFHPLHFDFRVRHQLHLSHALRVNPEREVRLIDVQLQLEWNKNRGS